MSKKASKAVLPTLFEKEKIVESEKEEEVDLQIPKKIEMSLSLKESDTLNLQIVRLEKQEKDERVILTVDKKIQATVITRHQTTQTKNKIEKLDNSRLFTKEESYSKIENESHLVLNKEVLATLPGQSGH